MDRARSRVSSTRKICFTVAVNDWDFFVSQFGKAGSPYDFEALDVGQLKEKAKELEESQKGMKKKVNPKVINMIDR